MPVRVYVLGGPSSVGKTTAAATIAERLGAAHLQLDPITRASQDPRVRCFGPGVDALWRLPAAHVCGLLVQKGDALATQLNTTISRCASGSSAGPRRSPDVPDPATSRTAAGVHALTGWSRLALPARTRDLSSRLDAVAPIISGAGSPTTQATG